MRAAWIVASMLIVAGAGLAVARLISGGSNHHPSLQHVIRSSCPTPRSCGIISTLDLTTKNTR